METDGKNDTAILKELQDMTDMTCEVKFKKDLKDARKLKALTFTMKTE